MFLIAALLLVVGAVLAVAAVLAYRRLNPDGPLATNFQQPAPALAASDDPARGDLAIATDIDGVAVDRVVQISVESPPGATEMQLGTDPTFATTPWVPVASVSSVDLGGAGYRMVFGRFRAGPGGPPSEVSVDGVDVDPTYAAATSSATGPHVASWARPLSPTAVVVRVEAGRLVRGGQEAYDLDAPPAGDDVSGWFGPKTISRDGEPYGRQVTDRNDLIKVYDRIVGRALDVDAAVGGQWTIDSETDGDVGPTLAVAAVERVSRPVGSGLGPDSERLVPVAHDLVLTLPLPLKPGNRYTIAAPDGLIAPVELLLDDDVTISPAVHVNQNGYGPDDRLKVGYVSGYPNGIGGGLDVEGQRFRVLDVASSPAVVAEGMLQRRPTGAELEQGDLTGSAVFEADFSSLGEPGRYRLCVDKIGCSVDFDVDEHVWRRLAVDVARSMYHQRSGTALGPPYTAIARPRPYHPDDGLVVNGSDRRLLDALADGPSPFGPLVDGARDEVVAEAWGGHFDAGDWDRRIQHLYYVRAAAELVELRPELIGALELGIPESGDAVPDVLDEALWTLDAFRRLQRSDGAVSGGIEASEHPQAGNTSWSDSLAVFAFDPDPWSSYVYAGVAAQAAAVLQPYDPARADGYLASALAAMSWAEAQPAEPANAELIATHRSVAAAALFKATGDEQWHDLFRATTTLGDGVDRFLSCGDHGACDAAWLYLTTDPSRIDPELRALIADSLVATADEVIAAAETTAFGWSVENRFAPLIWGLGVGGAPHTTALVRAWELTGDGRYREAAERSAAFSLGANPLNASYITGVGVEPVRHPLIVDTMSGGLPVWPGTPVYGNHRLDTATEGWVDDLFLEPAAVTPLAADAPYLWQWYDLSDVAMFNEYTVFQSHAPALYTFGLLAQ